MSPTKSSVLTEQMYFVQLLGKGLGEVHGLRRKAERKDLRLFDFHIKLLVKIQKQK